MSITFKGIFIGQDLDSSKLFIRLLPLSAVVILIPALSLITIFLYKSRKIQSWFAMSLIFLIVALILILSYGSYIVINEFHPVLTPGFRMILPVLILIFSALAYAGIKKDERLVNSYDRLR